MFIQASRELVLAVGYIFGMDRYYDLSWIRKMKGQLWFIGARNRLIVIALDWEYLAEFMIDRSLRRDKESSSAFRCRGYS